MVGKEIADQMEELANQSLVARRLQMTRQLVAYTERMALFKIFMAITAQAKLGGRRG